MRATVESRELGLLGGYELATAWERDPCASLQDYLQKALSKPERSGHQHAFRGVSRCHDNLRASIDRRLITAPRPIDVETQLLAEVLARAWEHLTPQERHRVLLAEARWGTRRNTAALIVARHRLVPTRCLDWSYDPLTALYFASQDHSYDDGEVWWFDRAEFDLCVAAQWPRVFGKTGHVEAEVEREFLSGAKGPWFTGLNYMLLPGDRPFRQSAWITIAGCLKTCHAQEIHSLGVRVKGRLVISSKHKPIAIRLLSELGITTESLGIREGDKADLVGREISEAFDREFPHLVSEP